MNLKITASTLFLYLICISIYAQKGETCSRDYSLLSYTINTELGTLEVDQELYLSHTYLKKLAAGEYNHKQSETKYFEYLRPASKKEIKQGMAEGEKYELLFGDGNIYGLSFLPTYFHFFSPRPGFEGSLAGTWEDPYLVLPLGLDPVNSESLMGTKFRVLETNPDYLLLEGNGTSYIFYPGYPDEAQVFARAEAIDQLESRKEMAQTLIGQRIFLANHPSLRYREKPFTRDLYLDEENPGLEMTVKEVISSANQVLLYSGRKDNIYVVLDEYAKFNMFDLDCLESENEQQWINYEDEQRKANQELTELLSSGEEIIDVFQNEWVTELLQGRFRLHQDIQAEKAEYKCLYLQDSEEHMKALLKAHVNIDGNIYLQSQYSSERGLYHTKIEVRVDGQMYLSDRIRALDPRSVRHRKDNRVVEEIHFKGDADNGILEAIAKNSDKEVIVRFTAGGSYFEDITLLPIYKDAIRDAWLLSQLIKSEEALDMRIRGKK